MSLFATFLQGQSINTVEGIVPMTRAQLLTLERRGEERIAVQNPMTVLTHRHSELQLPTHIIDLNFFGVLLEFAEGLTAKVEQYPRDLALHLGDEEGQFKIECLIFDTHSPYLNMAF